ncbi:MAG: hypothetical protein RIC55_08940 [Pirellulaceae bacterium]
MRRTCTTCLLTFGLTLSVALLAGCNPNDLVDMAGPAPADQADASPAPEAEQPVDDTPDREVATAGVGKKGRFKGDGPLRTPLRQHALAPQRIVLDIQIPTMIRQYKALDPDGKGPSSHEVFMKEIIEAARIELPVLPEGDRYEYDPEDEQLYVVHEN